MRLILCAATAVGALTAASAMAQTSHAAPAPLKTSPAQTSAKPTPPVTDEPTTGNSAAAPGQTGNTPGQSQTSPGEASQLTPAVTGTTPSGQTTGPATDQTTTTSATTTTTTVATKADLKAGALVYDQSGGEVGKLVSSSAKGAVVDTGTVKVTIPAASFGKSDKGLVIAMSKSEIEAAAKPTKTTKKPKA